jgi:hypothetical protein
MQCVIGREMAVGGKSFFSKLVFDSFLVSFCGSQHSDQHVDFELQQLHFVLKLPK